MNVEVERQTRLLHCSKEIYPWHMYVLVNISFPCAQKNQSDMEGSERSRTLEDNDRYRCANCDPSRIEPQRRKIIAANAKGECLALRDAERWVINDPQRIPRV
jgi:hypothetical protein